MIKAVVDYSEEEEDGNYTRAKNLDDEPRWSWDTGVAGDPCLQRFYFLVIINYWIKHISVGKSQLTIYISGVVVLIPVDCGGSGLFSGYIHGVKAVVIPGRLHP